MTKYRVLAIREGDWWALEFPDVDDRIHSQAKRLEHAPAVAAQAIAFSLGLDVSPDEIDLEVHVEATLEDRVREAKHLRDEAHVLTRRANHAMQSAAVHAVDQGLTLRDAGRLLGVSFQRVSQLMRDGA